MHTHVYNFGLNAHTLCKCVVCMSLITVNKIYVKTTAATSSFQDLSGCLNIHCYSYEPYTFVPAPHHLQNLVLGGHVPGAWLEEGG